MSDDIVRRIQADPALARDLQSRAQKISDGTATEDDQLKLIEGIAESPEQLEQLKPLIVPSGSLHKAASVTITTITTLTTFTA